MNKYLKQRDSLNKFKEIGKSTILRARSLFKLRKRVKEALILKDFSFSILNRINVNTEIEEIINKESGVTKIFIFPFEVQSKKYYSFIRILQNTGFDIYTIFSIPKGD